MRRLLATLLIGGGLFSQAAFSDESVQDQIDVRADLIEYLEEGKLLVAKGNVIASYQGVRLEAPEVSIQLDSKIAQCKGRAKVYQGERVFEGEGLIYDFENESGEASHASIKDPPTFTGGDHIEQKGRDWFEIENGYVTTCDLDEPHYRVTTKHITVYPNDKVVAHNAVIWTGPVPIFFVPSYTYSLNSYRPKISTVFGSRKEWGNYLLTSWDFEWGNKIKGDWMFDTRDNLGFGYGTNLDYTSKLGQGHSKIYTTSERRRDRPQGSPAKKDRYQLSLQHDWRMSEKTRLFLEFNKRSDSSFVKDYFEREFEKENNPETHLDWTHHADSGSVEFYLRKRANHFESVSERLPQVRGHLKSRSLGLDSLYYTSDLALTNFEDKDGINQTSHDLLRFDAINRLEHPMRVNPWLWVNPHSEIRETVYSRAKEDNGSLTSGSLSSGLDLHSRFSKFYTMNFPFQGEEEIKIRHVVTPQMRYLYRSSPTVGRKKILEIDGPDRVDRLSQVEISLEQKWQRKVIGADESSTVRDLIRLFVKGEYDFEGEKGSELTRIWADLEFRPTERIALDADAWYDAPSKDLLQMDLDVRFEGKDGSKWTFGHRYQENSSVQETLEIEKRLSSKWQVRLYERYNIKNIDDDGIKSANDFLEQEYTVVRDLHCWEAEFNYNIQQGHEVWLVFRLKQFPELPFNLKQKSYFPAPGNN